MADGYKIVSEAFYDAIRMKKGVWADWEDIIMKQKNRVHSRMLTLY